MYTVCCIIAGSLWKMSFINSLETDLSSWLPLKYGSVDSVWFTGQMSFKTGLTEFSLIFDCNSNANIRFTVRMKFFSFHLIYWSWAMCLMPFESEWERKKENSMTDSKMSNHHLNVKYFEWMQNDNIKKNSRTFHKMRLNTYKMHDINWMYDVHVCVRVCGWMMNIKIRDIYHIKKNIFCKWWKITHTWCGHMQTEIICLVSSFVKSNYIIIFTACCCFISFGSPSRIFSSYREVNCIL